LQEFASRLAADRNFGEVVIVDWKRAHDAESDLDCVDFKLQLRSLIAHPWAAPSVTRK